MAGLWLPALVEQLQAPSSARAFKESLAAAAAAPQGLPGGPWPWAEADLGQALLPGWGSTPWGPNGSQVKAGRGEERAQGRDARLAALLAGGGWRRRAGAAGARRQGSESAASSSRKVSQKSRAKLRSADGLWESKGPSNKRSWSAIQTSFPSLDRGKFTVASIFSWRGLIQVCECQETCSDLLLFKLRMLKHQPSNKRHIESKICNGARVTLRLVECVWWLFSAELGGGERKRPLIFLNEIMENMT